jgi:hypothetical protein
LDTTGEAHLEKYTERTKLAAVEAYQAAEIPVDATGLRSSMR